MLHRVYLREGTGSYAGILAKGMTSMPETWDAMVDGRQSLNHCMLGHVMEWYYGYIAGIRQQPGSVGWQQILIAPEPGPDHAEATLHSPAGRVTSRWTVAAGLFHLAADIPEGTTAELVAPDGTKRQVGPGHHTLECTLPPSAP